MKAARVLLVLALLAGCTKSEPIGAQAPEGDPTAMEPTAAQSPAADEPPAPVADATATQAPAAASAPVRTEPDRSCQVDSDCVAARAFAGLDHIPADPTKGMCGDLCFVAMSKAAVESWEAKRTELEAQVPCDKKFGKCGSPGDVKVACIRSRCQITE